MKAQATGQDSLDFVSGKKVLLLEDSALIALDAADSLRELGAGEVVQAASNPAALTLVESGGIELAVLDFNLGRETSAPTADRLMQDGIPFVFASGYGGEGAMPDRFAGVPVIVKPYGNAQMAAAFAALANSAAG